MLISALSERLNILYYLKKLFADESNKEKRAQWPVVATRSEVDNVFTSRLLSCSDQGLYPLSFPKKELYQRERSIRCYWQECDRHRYDHTR